MCKNYVVMLIFQFLSLSLTAQLTSDIRPGRIELSEPQGATCILDDRSLTIKYLDRDVELDVGNNFLQMRIQPGPNNNNQASILHLDPEQLQFRRAGLVPTNGGNQLVSENAYLSPGSLLVSYFNEDEKEENGWELVARDKGNTLRLQGIERLYSNGTVLFDSAQPALVMQKNPDNTGSDMLFGLLRTPSYTFDIEHETTLGQSLWTGQNGLSIRNGGDRNRRWLHYVANEDGAYTFLASGVIKAEIDLTSGNWVPMSDRRLKKSIQPVPDGLLAKINRLRPTTYRFKNQESDRKVYGLIAQEVQRVFPDIVLKTGENGEQLGVSYTELIPILIGGLQEQQADLVERDATINQMKAELSALKTAVNKLEAAVLGTAEATRPVVAQLSSARLFQNAPNPAGDRTVIPYYLPPNAHDARLTVSDVQGRLIKTVPLTQTGHGEVRLGMNSLDNGTYQYTLWIANERVATLSMIRVEK